MIAPTDRLTVTLEAQAWETAMRAMAKAPYESIAAVIVEIQRQCATQDEAVGAPFNRAAWGDGDGGNGQVPP